MRSKQLYNGLWWAFVICLWYHRYQSSPSYSRHEVSFQESVSNGAELETLVSSVNFVQPVRRLIQRCAAHRCPTAVGMDSQQRLERRYRLCYGARGLVSTVVSLIPTPDCPLSRGLLMPEPIVSSEVLTLASLLTRAQWYCRRTQCAVAEVTSVSS